MFYNYDWHDVEYLLRVRTPGDTKVKNPKKAQSIQRLEWNKINKEQFQIIIQNELQQLIRDTNYRSGSVDKRLENLCQILHKATKESVPTKVIKLKGPAWKASSKAKDLMKNCKLTYKLWVENGRKDQNLKKDTVTAKRALRKQLRREKFEDRKSFYDDLMSNPSTDKFYQLIRRNKMGHQSSACCLMSNGEEVRSPE